MAKSWREKRDKEQEPKVVDVPPKMRKRFGPGRMVIATPRIIDGMVRKIPEGKLATVHQIMDKLCEDFETEAACPMTTGIFLGMVAKAAEEERAAGITKIAPYWRVLSPHSNATRSSGDPNLLLPCTPALISPIKSSPIFSPQGIISTPSTRAGWSHRPRSLQGKATR